MSKKKPENLMTLESAPERAREAIREMINKGDIEPGQRIDQRMLAKKLELTTVPIREALCWLEAEGLVKRIPGCGVFCKAYTVDDIQELLEVRGVLEALAAGLAAVNSSSRQKETLAALVGKMNEVSGSRQEEFLKMHVEFHRLIVEMSGNESLMNIWQMTHITEQVLVRLASHLWPADPHDHKPLAEVILSGDRAEAERVMREHIMPTYEERLRLLREEYGDNPIL